MPAARRDLHARFGVARADITPPPGIRSRTWGAAHHDVAAGVHRPLTATALAILPEHGEPRVVVSLDLMEWQATEDELTVRNAIRDRCGLRVEDLILHCTHTHSAPAPCSRHTDLPGGAGIPGHLEQIASAAADAAAAAIADASPGTLSWGTGAARLAAHRDQDLDGRAVVGWDPQVEPEDTLMVGRIVAATGQVRAVVVGYACHPTVLGWQNTLLSPDYVGALREQVEAAEPGALCLFLQGASGELAPAHQYSADPEDADRAGRSLAHGVAAVLELMDPPDHHLVLQGVVESGAPLGVWSVQPTAGRHDVSTTLLTVPIPRRTPPGVPQVGPIPEHVRAERATRAADVAQAAGHDAHLDHQVWLWQLGDLVLVAHPGEAYSWLARRLRTALAPRPVVVANLSNGAGAFYLPPAAAYDTPAYAVGQTPAGPGSLEAIASAVLESLSAHHDHE